jgi:hypothetical protein
MGRFDMWHQEKGHFRKKDATKTGGGERCEKKVHFIIFRKKTCSQRFLVWNCAGKRLASSLREAERSCKNQPFCQSVCKLVARSQIYEAFMNTAFCLTSA